MLDGIVFEFLLGAVLLKARRDQAKLKAGLRLRTKLNNQAYLSAPVAQIVQCDDIPPAGLVQVGQESTDDGTS